MNRAIKNIIIPLFMLLCLNTVRAQVDKGVTSTGKEIGCSTIHPSVDKAVNEYGKGLLRILAKQGKLLCFSIQ